MRYLFTIICGLYVLISPQICFALTCTANTTAISISPVNISAQNSTPIDSKIGTTATSASGLIYSCTTNNYNDYLNSYRYSVRVVNGNYVKTIDGKRIYQSNLKGIGYAVGATLSDSQGCNADGWIGSGDNYNSYRDSRVYCSRDSTAQGLSGTINFSGKIQVEFYKIEQTIANGVVNIGNIGYVLLAPNNLENYPSQPAIVVNSFNFIRPACQTGGIVYLNLGSVERKEFNGVGTVSNTMARNGFDVQCTNNTDVYVQIDGNVLDASKGLLNITPGSSSAKGVAIQITDGALVPLKLSTPFYGGKFSAGRRDYIFLNARYYQTEPTITPGVANATATYTLTYK